MGDITYTCNSSDLAETGEFDEEFVNIIVNLSVNVTNDIDEDTDELDVVLTVNDGTPQQGFLISPTQVAFDGVLIPFPGFNAGPTTTTIRITALRGNASQAGIPGPGQQVPVTAVLSSEPAAILAVPNPSVIVGLSWLSLISDGVDDAIEGLQCVELDEDDAELDFHEGFASAWKTQGDSSSDESSFWESGFQAKTADQETQFMVSFSGVPDDVTISVQNRVFGNNSNLELTLLEGSGDDDFNDLCDSPADFREEVDLDGDGDGYVIYGVCNTDPVVRENISIPIHAEWAEDDDDNLLTPDVGSASVTISYFPLGGSNEADEDDPEPRFVDTASAPEEFLSVAKCVTTLLFPFVTNQSGFDTGLVVSNTSEDWGLSAIDSQEGECEIHYIGTDTSGEMPDNDVTDSDVEAGTQLVWLLSSGGTHGLVGAADFQGYILAACDFQYAHGYAFITDGFGGGTPALAQGYLALVIPANRGISDGGAETLGN